MNIRIFVFLVCLTPSFLRAPNEVTYELSGGRFGDNLVAYLHAKWIAYKHGLLLRYQPFEYSDELVLHRRERAFDKSKKYDQIIKLTDKMSIEKTGNNLYVVPYYPECFVEYKQFKNQYPFYRAVDWSDLQFLHIVRAFIRPLRPLRTIPLPSDRLCIAIHVRRGGGYDAGLLSDNSYSKSELTPADVAYPLKFPPDKFYLEQLKAISVFFNNAPLYVYLFTDDRNPQRLAERYRQELHLPNIVFDYRKTSNSYHLNVLEDFFAMMQFPVLLRSESSFSLAASKLACRQLVIHPLQANYSSNEKWTRGCLEITEFARTIGRY